MYTISELASKTVRLCLEDVSTIVNFNDKHNTRDERTKILPKLKRNPNEFVETTRDQLPSTTFLKDNDPWIPQMGFGLNEIEFSVNIHFRNVKFKSGPCVHYMIRNYFKEKPLKIYVNETENFLTTKRENSTMRELIWPAIVFRIDNFLYRPENQEYAVGLPGAYSKQRATAKLRIFQRKFFVEGIEIKLSGSTEIDLSDVTDSVMQAKCINERKNVSYIVYWYVSLLANVIPSKSYTFRIAFRLHNERAPPNLEKMSLLDFLNAFADTHAECNIECEDEITGPMFLDCVKALVTYYKFQHEMTNEIEPDFVAVTLTAIIASNEDSQALTEQQLALLTRMKLKSPLEEVNELSTPDVLLGNFVGALSMKAWAKRILKQVSEYADAETSEYFGSRFQLPNDMF